MQIWSVRIKRRIIYFRQFLIRHNQSNSFFACSSHLAKCFSFTHSLNSLNCANKSLRFCLCCTRFLSSQHSTQQEEKSDRNSCQGTRVVQLRFLYVSIFFFCVGIIIACPIGLRTSNPSDSMFFPDSLSSKGLVSTSPQNTYNFLRCDLSIYLSWL